MSSDDAGVMPPEPPVPPTPEGAETPTPIPSVPEPPAITPPPTPAAPAVPAPPAPPPVVPPTYSAPTAASGEPQPSTTQPAQSSGVATAVIIASVIALFVGLFAGVIGGYFGAHLTSLFGGSGTVSVNKVRVVPNTTSDPVVATAAAALPSVVSIDVRGGSTTGDSSLPGGHPDVPTTGSGSGVAYKRTASGGTYIITNNHVVENADRLTVHDESGNAMSATVVGTDPDTDIAVIEVKNELPIIEVGDSSKLIVGQSVVAIGSPFGLEQSVTSGIVSALARSLPDMGLDGTQQNALVDVIQTDAAINPGNSGGALVDDSGALVGINTAIYSESGMSGGIGFAIPVNTATRVADQLIEGGEITHPFIGVVGQTVDEQLVTEKKLTATEGAYVVEITPGTGSAQGGVKVGDVITKVDGETIRSMDDLVLQVRRKGVGDTVTLTVVRGGETVELQVKVGDRPANLGATPQQETTPTDEVPLQ